MDFLMNAEDVVIVHSVLKGINFIMDHKKIAVSVICSTYNQCGYIEKAIKSIVSQKTTFPFELIIHDDASDDGTTAIIREYQEKYPSIIKAIVEVENTYSRGIDVFTSLIKNTAKGKYIALCEGDDFWIDENKLQNQFEALEKHLECDMCACRTNMVSEDGILNIGEIRPRINDGILSMDDVILGGGNYVATAGLFYRKSMYDHMFAFEKIRSLDYAVQMKGALRGGIFYIDKPMAAYRRYSKHSITEIITHNNDAMNLQVKQEMNILNTLDIDTNGKYHEVIVNRLKDYHTTFYDQLMERRSEVLRCIQKESGIYIWGMGLRGRALEKFLKENKIAVDGICDITDRFVGQRTDVGNEVLSSDYVIKTAKQILASVKQAYDYLIDTGFEGKIINMQEYMPRA